MDWAGPLRHRHRLYACMPGVLLPHIVAWPLHSHVHERERNDKAIVSFGSGGSSACFLCDSARRDYLFVFQLLDRWPSMVVTRDPHIRIPSLIEIVFDARLKGGCRFLH